jgi:hypothetical protein
MESKKQPKSFLFEKRNYQILFLALAVVSLGFILMAGGGSDNPAVYNPEIFNFQRIRLAPTLVICGFGIAIYAILAGNKKPNG